MLAKAGRHVRNHSVAYLALFVALGGTAVALPGKNTVFSDDIKNKQVKKGDLAPTALNKHIITRTFTVPATQFQNPAPILAKVPKFGKFELLYCGNDPQDGQMRIRLLSFNSAAPFMAVGQATGDNLPAGLGDDDSTDLGGGTTFGGGGGEPLIAEGDAPDGGVAGKFDWQISRGTGANAKGAHFSASGINTSSDVDPTGECTVTAQTVIQR